MTTPFLSGLAAHTFHPLLKKFDNTPEQIILMLRYVIGGVVILLANHKKTIEDDGVAKANETTYRLSFVMVLVGFGVLIGHFLEQMYYIWSDK